MKTPSTYASLAPFRDYFDGGLPILMYHKLGPRPRGVRLKGLYVGERLFDRQLRELREAGYRSCDFEALGEGVAAGPGQIGITFDDGYVNVLRHGLGPLHDHGFQALQYIVADKIGGGNDWDLPAGEAYEPLMDAAQLREWLAAGHLIGSHTCSHAHLPEIRLEQAREEIVASKKKLEDLFGVPVTHFCYPYGQWNERIRDLVIEAGYRTATTTRFGLNQAATSPFELLRIQARYQSWGLRSLRQRLFG
ncbi:MAG TPA: polysaccharide deacetylase family protein [Nevskia sp.]|nr:polysaccharide deacetylase family protein [Nevskia sp.]